VKPAERGALGTQLGALSVKTLCIKCSGPSAVPCNTFSNACFESYLGAGQVAKKEKGEVGGQVASWQIK